MKKSTGKLLKGAVLPLSDTPWYDNMEEIRRSLGSLSKLNCLLRARSGAWRREEQLSEYYLFGYFWLDSCGNCRKAVNYAPKDEFPNIPDVLTKDEFFRLLGNNRIVSFGIQSNIPDERIKCSFCGNVWQSYNCYDTVRIASTEVYPLDEFVGKTLGDVKSAYAERTDAEYFMQPDILVRNNRFVDLSLKYPGSNKSWEKDAVVNPWGWMSQQDGITDQYIVEVGDEGFFNKWKYYHRQCHLDSVEADSDFLDNNGCFKNLAGAAYADIVIRKELVDAGIGIIQNNQTRSEVPYTLTGQLGKYSFTRAWIYWIVNGKVPLTIAQEMYANDMGTRSVRVEGHCGCPPPEEWATYSDFNGKAFVNSYHIDDMQGLKFFIATLRKHHFV